VFISFIIPAYNSHETLSECIGSIIKLPGLQNNYEIIIVLCRGKKKELEIANSFKEKADVKLIKTDIKNRSLSRNLGVDNAKGEFLAFIDSDVKLDKYWLHNILPPLIQNKLLAASQGCFEMDRKNKIHSPNNCFVPDINHCITSSFGPVIVTGACVYRRDIFFKLGKFDENILWNEDLDLSVKAFNNGYGLSYQRAAKAIILYKKISFYAMLKRNYTSGKFHCHLVKHKYAGFKYWRNIKYITNSFSLKLAYSKKDSNKFFIQAASVLSLVSKLVGFTNAFLFNYSKSIYHFPLYMKPYTGLTKEYMVKYPDYGLIVVNKQRFLFNSKIRELLCIR
jgi:glycosyltransferase involved in cell wall biosynthesis